MRMCDGRVLYRDGAYPTIDVKKAKAEVMRSVDEVLAEL